MPLPLRVPRRQWFNLRGGLPRPLGLCLAAPLLTLALAGCQTPAATQPAPPPPPTNAEAVGEVFPGSGFVKGYLARPQLPDSLALLPKPPADGSSAQAADMAMHQATRSLRGSPRWTQAARDSELGFPQAAESFACALGAPINAEATPHLTMLLRRSLMDAAFSTFGAKNHYQRQRPFVALKESSCAPQEEAKLVKDGSYPSGHAAAGWTWALILAELAPERADALLQRGHAFGQSRVICGVHWQSDVDNGRLMGAAAVAKLHADPTFLAQAALARNEIQQAQRQGLALPPLCSAQP